MMKTVFIPVLFLSALILASCEQKINPALPSATPVYVVDAFINNKLDTQVINLTYSQPYFQEELPPGVSGADVVIRDHKGNAFPFSENPRVKGSYIWVPSGTGFGTVGSEYTLLINVNGEILASQTKMGGVPKIDSISFSKENGMNRNKNFYRGQFWATDLKAQGDTYWIKAYKNGVLLNKPSEINVAYDAGFTKGSDINFVTFIPPIRAGINPDDTDSNSQPVSPYSPGDSVYVEIHSLTEASFNFLTQVATQTNRPGGFSELFATPLANVSTNIHNADSNGTVVVGFFNVASVSGLGKRFVQ